MIFFESILLDQYCWKVDSVFCSKFSIRVVDSVCVPIVLITLKKIVHSVWVIVFLRELVLLNRLEFCNAAMMHLYLLLF